MFCVKNYMITKILSIRPIQEFQSIFLRKITKQTTLAIISYQLLAIYCFYKRKKKKAEHVN